MKFNRPEKVLPKPQVLAFILKQTSEVLRELLSVFRHLSTNTCQNDIGNWL